MLPIDTTGINNSQANIVLRWYRYWGRIISNGDRGAWSLMWLPWKPRANCSDGEAISHRKQNHLMGCLLAGRSNCWHLDFDRWTRMRILWSTAMAFQDMFSSWSYDAASMLVEVWGNHILQASHATVFCDQVNAVTLHQGTWPRRTAADETKNLLG